MAGAGRLKHLVTDELTQLSDEGKAIDIKFWREKIDALDFSDKEQLHLLRPLKSLLLRSDSVFFPHLHSKQLRLKK